MRPCRAIHFWDMQVLDAQRRVVCSTNSLPSAVVDIDTRCPALSSEIRNILRVVVFLFDDEVGPTVRRHGHDLEVSTPRRSRGRRHARQRSIPQVLGELLR